MVINGGSRTNWRFFSAHLARTDTNDLVEVAEIRGVFATDLREALREMHAVASGSRTKNFMYHANLNPAEDERLTAEQWQEAVDRLEHNLGLDGHARIVVRHEKENREHCHVIWQRVDPDTMTAVSDSHDYRRHQITARELEEAFDLSRLESVTVKDRDAARPDRRGKNHETFRSEPAVDIDAMKAELTALWQASDSGVAFQSAIEDAGYFLARGDRRDFVVVDAFGADHSLARRISGEKAAGIRQRMGDVDRNSLPSVTEARALARAFADADAGAPAEIWADLPDPAADTYTDATRAEQATAAPADPGPANYTAAEGRSGAAYEDIETRQPADYNDMPEEAGTRQRMTPWGRAWTSVTEQARDYAARLSAFWHEAEEARAKEGISTWKEYVTKRAGRELGEAATRLWQDRIKPGLAQLGRFMGDESGASETPLGDLEAYAQEWLTGEDALPMGEDRGGDDPSEIETDKSPSLG